MHYLIMSVILFLMNCANQGILINYDNTNPIRIEEATQGIKLNKLLPSSDQLNGTIALKTIELNRLAEHLDIGVIYMIEDNLITNLINNNYRVLERDPQALKNLYQESSTQYRKFNEEYVFDKKEYINTDLSSSDFILSYRVLECGVVYTSLDSQDPANIGRVNRSARTRLHLRLTDTKTGEIIYAGIAENELIDIVNSSDIENLKQISYNYYHHTLPLQKPEKNVNTTNENNSISANASQEAKTKPQENKGNPNKKVLGFVGAVMALLMMISAN